MEGKKNVSLSLLKMRNDCRNHKKNTGGKQLLLGKRNLIENMTSLLYLHGKNGKPAPTASEIIYTATLEALGGKALAWDSCVHVRKSHFQGMLF